MSSSGTFQLASVVKNLKRWQFNPWSGRFPGVGNGNPVQNSCPGNATDRKAWQATVYGVAKSETQLSTAQHRVSIIYGCWCEKTTFPLVIQSSSSTSCCSPSLFPAELTFLGSVPGRGSRGPVPELKADLLLQQNPKLEGFHKPLEN